MIVILFRFVFGWDFCMNKEWKQESMGFWTIHILHHVKRAIHLCIFHHWFGLQILAKTYLFQNQNTINALKNILNLMPIILHSDSALYVFTRVLRLGRISSSLRLCSLNFYNSLRISSFSTLEVSPELRYGNCFFWNTYSA